MAAKKKNSRNKGHSFERKIAKDMQSIGYKGARRQLEYHTDDANGVDIQQTPPFKIQCKAMKNQPSIHKVMDEVEAEREEIPVVIYKVDRKGTYAAFKIDDALRLMKIFKENL
jgi:hypothetical protein